MFGVKQMPLMETGSQGCFLDIDGGALGHLITGKEEGNKDRDG
jgi:hypothetical protein